MDTHEPVYGRLSVRSVASFNHPTDPGRYVEKRLTLETLFGMSVQESVERVAAWRNANLSAPIRATFTLEL